MSHFDNRPGDEGDREGVRNETVEMKGVREKILESLNVRKTRELQEG